MTPYDDLTSGIPQGLAKTPQQKEDAKDTLKDSVSSEDDFKVIVSAQKTLQQVQALVAPFDSTLKVELLYARGARNYFEITSSKDSPVGTELLADIDNGKVPESLLGLEVVKPELLGIEDVNGEDTQSTR